VHPARLAALLVVVAACSEWPISARDIPGTYVMNRGRAADTLILLQHGRYRHIYRMPGQRVAIDSGTWLVTQSGHQIVVRFSALWQRWRNETDFSYVLRAPLTPVSWSVEPSRTVSGRMRLDAEEALDWAYVRRGGVPEGRDRPGVRDGDIIFQTSRSSQSLAIQRATHSQYSHMGLILYRNGEPYVFEAVATVRYTPLDAWIARGTHQRYVVKRLRDADTVLTPAAIAKLRAAAEAFQQRPYDLTFEWSDSRLYCSELVWKAFDRGLGIQIGALQDLGSFDLTDAEVRAQMQKRYGDRVPLEERVISPAAMFGAGNLITVTTR
jgi:hypothetical protein